MHEWIAVCLRPRETITAIISKNPNRLIILFSFIYGMLSLLNLFVMIKYITYEKLILLIAISPIYGYIAISIWSFLTYWFAKWLGGSSSFVFVRAAFSWSCAPLACNLVIWAFLLIGFPYVFFSSSEEPVLLSKGQSFIFFLLLLGKLVFALWSLIIYIRMLAEVNNFSIGRSLATIALSFASLLFILNLLLLI